MSEAIQQPNGCRARDSLCLSTVIGSADPAISRIRETVHDKTAAAASDCPLSFSVNSSEWE
jgi:hypothetical protein